MVEERLASTRWTTDTEMRVIDVSGDAYEIPPEVLGRRVGEILEDAPPEPARAHRRALLGEAVTHEVQLGDRIVLAHVEPLRDDAGAIIGVAGVALDITERSSGRRGARGCDVATPRDGIRGVGSRATRRERSRCGGRSSIHPRHSSDPILVLDPYGDEILGRQPGHCERPWMRAGRDAWHAAL